MVNIIFFQSWDSYFRNSAQGGVGYQPPPSLAPLGKNEVSASALFASGAVTGAAGYGGTGQVSEKIIDDHLAVQAIIRSYQVFLMKINMFLLDNFLDLNLLTHRKYRKTCKDKLTVLEVR